MNTFWHFLPHFPQGTLSNYFSSNYYHYETFSKAILPLLSTLCKTHQFFPLKTRDSINNAWCTYSKKNGNNFWNWLWYDSIRKFRMIVVSAIYGMEFFLIMNTWIAWAMSQREKMCAVLINWIVLVPSEEMEGRWTFMSHQINRRCTKIVAFKHSHLHNNKSCPIIFENYRRLASIEIIFAKPVL